MICNTVCFRGCLAPSQHLPITLSVSRAQRSPPYSVWRWRLTPPASLKWACDALSLQPSFTCLYQRSAPIILWNPGQQRRSELRVAVSPLRPCDRDLLWRAARSARTGSGGAMRLFGFFAGQLPAWNAAVREGADAPLAMTGSRKQSFQAALVFFYAVQLTAGNPPQCASPCLHSEKPSC